MRVCHFSDLRVSAQEGFQRTFAHFSTFSTAFTTSFIKPAISTCRCGRRLRPCFLDLFGLEAAAYEVGFVAATSNVVVHGIVQLIEVVLDHVGQMLELILPPFHVLRLAGEEGLLQARMDALELRDGRVCLCHHSFVRKAKKQESKRAETKGSYRLSSGEAGCRS